MERLFAMHDFHYFGYPVFIGGDIISEVHDLLNDVEKLRKNLLNLIEKKEGNLQDPEILAASQILNAAISKYNNFISKKF